MTKMMWIARRDGDGWNSNRLRDVVDMAFTVYKPTDTLPCKVVVRGPWWSGEGSRARRTLGTMYFNTVEEAKNLVQQLLTTLDESLPMTHEKIAANTASLLSGMLALSLEPSPIHRPYAIIRGAMAYKTSATPVTPTEAADMIAKIDESANAMQDILNSVKYGEPAPAGYMWLGKQLVKMGWPQ